MSAVVLTFDPSRRRRRRPAPDVDRYDTRDVRTALADALAARRLFRERLQDFEPTDFEYVALHRALSALTPEIQRLADMLERRGKLRVVRNG